MTSGDELCPLAPAESFTYPAPSRLRKGWEFDAVFRTGRLQKGELVRIIFLRQADTSAATRFGAVVSKKIAGAVCRSRGKRLIREAVRHLYRRVQRGWMIVVSMRDRGLSAKSPEIERCLETLLRRAGLLEVGRGGVLV